MFAWLKALFSGMDRQTAAAERAAKASEDIADMLESVRDQLRGRLGIESPQPAVAALPASPPAGDESAEDGEPEGGKQPAGGKGGRRGK